MTTHPRRTPRARDTRDRIQRIDSALEAAEYAEEELEGAEELLSRAARLGRIDLMGGGPLVSLSKLQQLDRVREHVEEARYWISELEDDIGPIGSELPDVEIDQATRMTDVLAGMLLLDLQMQKRITDALKSVRAELREFAAIQASLFAERKRITRTVRE